MYYAFVVVCGVHACFVLCMHVCVCTHVPLLQCVCVCVCVCVRVQNFVDVLLPDEFDRQMAEAMNERKRKRGLH